MNIIIAVDANIMLSALLGGKSAVVLFDPRFEFVTTKHTMGEVERYVPKVAGKLNVAKDLLSDLLARLPVVAYETTVYADSLETSTKLIGAIDPYDVDILALALHFESYLWSQDKDFEQAGYHKLLKTYHFIE